MTKQAMIDVFHQWMEQAEHNGNQELFEALHFALLEMMRGA